MREIITLQLGHLSNYVATHFWNAQESYFTYSADETPLVDHDVHWRAGYGADGSETFLPRTVIYDLKGGFGSLRKINALYDVDPDADAASSSLWPGGSEVRKQAPLGQSDYQQSLDAGTAPSKLTTSNVRYWSDFSRVYYHPRSLVQLYDYELHSTVMPFEKYSMGSELFSSLDKEQDIVDRDWRPFVEECDRLEGIQVFTSLDDAWGGFASSYIEALRDEYPKTCIWTWGLQSPMLSTPRDKRQLRIANVAQSIGNLCSHASTVVPLSIPEDRKLPQNIHLDWNSTWHTSALLATAIETATLPSRLLAQRGVSPVGLSDLAECLNAAGNQYLASLKFVAGINKQNVEAENEATVDLFNIAKQKTDKPSHGSPFGKLQTARGVNDEDEEEDDDGNAQNKSSIGRQLVGDPVLRRYKTELKFALLDSFPEIYSDFTTQDSMPVVSTLTTDKTISTRMKNLRSQIGWSIGVDERENLNSLLADIGDAYQDDWSSGSDDGDDSY